MQYSEVLTYMYSQLPMYQRQGTSAFKKDLTNIYALTDAMGKPQEKFRSIHIAGTNGKGTVGHIIAAGLQAHGLKVGMYTSPHYVDFRERIKINGTFISEADVVRFVLEHKALFEEVKPSFFEMTVAMAFVYFADEEVDVAIIETGLGGRLDSTNIITPLMSVITNISLDHQAMLGNTLTLIAGEKAGIIKPGVACVVGESAVETDEVFVQKGIEQESEVIFADRHAELVSDDKGISFTIGDEIWVENIKTNLTSTFQKKNLLTAIYSLYQLREQFDLNPEVIKEGIENIYKLTYYIGRWQQLGRKPLVLADSAHNVAGVTELLANISKIEAKQLHIVIGMVNDKDLSAVLELLPKQAKYYFAKANIPRGLPADELMNTAAEYNLMGEALKSVDKAYKKALDQADTSDLVLVMGSVFVVAEVLSLIGTREDNPN